jgi:transcriptional regulator with XRE-family HTH domain
MPEQKLENLCQLGENIRIARKLRRLTQDDLGCRASVGRQVIVNLERGRPIKTDSLLQVLYALGLDKQLIDAISLENDPVGLRLAKSSLPKSIKERIPQGMIDEDF